MQYLIVKHSHMLFVAITILLFNLRFFLLWKNPQKPLGGLLKALPHLNDTMLLFTGLWLMKLTHFTPFNAPWLAVKIVLLLVYIGFGVAMMRSAPRSNKFYVTYLCAMACVATIVYMALFKPYF
ncbi:SirB family protein [Neisseria sp. N95_16]|uniref:SirB family protein n=1 Tax=Neisseria brasiliensis TaxID=2666100 RepID=A0A5Q3S6K0_9NEIS|nr:MULTISPECIES: SirB2 family protein [Neisseria]MRN39135.1 SirB family protein [Neisseria brasiliensis]PJO10231.1 SirB family protein [Neisseria sp. N95_16]PJO78575.1 SirB family protein [Neisseria sp. N177_16]QGL25948.1 SirB family protein [Neisseria brasiliensis]